MEHLPNNKQSRTPENLYKLPIVTLSHNGDDKIFNISSWKRILHSQIQDSFILDLRGSYIIGKGKKCDVKLTESMFETNIVAWKLIEEQHIKIFKENGKVYIEDLSGSHSWINKIVLSKNKPKELKHGSLIALGLQTSILFVYYDTYDRTSETFPKEIKNRYYISSFLGSGGFGKVYLIHEKENLKRFALKQVEKIGYNEEKEAKMLQDLDYPSIIKLYNSHATESNIYFILELMTGGDLYQRIKKYNGRLSESLARFYFYQIVLGLKYLHDRKIAHRDLKPENILLETNKDETLLKITDFGLSKEDKTYTYLKTHVGTLNYMAPEVKISKTKLTTYTIAVDIWSLGIILYFCFFSEFPAFNMNFTFNFPPYWAKYNETKDLIKNMLIVDPKRRFSAYKILKHIWLQDEKMKKAVNSVMYPDKIINNGEPNIVNRIVPTKTTTNLKQSKLPGVLEQKLIKMTANIELNEKPHVAEKKTPFYPIKDDQKFKFLVNDQKNKIIEKNKLIATAPTKKTEIAKVTPINVKKENYPLAIPSTSKEIETNPKKKGIFQNFKFGSPLLKVKEEKKFIVTNNNNNNPVIAEAKPKANSPKMESILLARERLEEHKKRISQLQAQLRK